MAGSILGILIILKPEVLFDELFGLGLNKHGFWDCTVEALSIMHVLTRLGVQE